MVRYEILPVKHASWVWEPRNTEAHLPVQFNPYKPQYKDLEGLAPFARTQWTEKLPQVR